MSTKAMKVKRYLSKVKDIKWFSNFLAERIAYNQQMKKLAVSMGDDGAYEQSFIDIYQEGLEGNKLVLDKLKGHLCN